MSEPVPWVAHLEPAVHGAAAAGAAPSDGSNLAGEPLDFSFNGNVIGPPTGAIEALRNVDVSRYPDRDALALRRAIARRHGVGIDHVVVGNGSTELIWAVARAYLAPGRAALVVGPTYGEYAVASAATGAEVSWPDAPPLPNPPPRGGEGTDESLSPREFQVPGSRFQVQGSTLNSEPGTRNLEPYVVWLCHPNNPTGAPFPIEGLAQLMDRAPRALFVVDEAYLPLCRDLASALRLVGTGRVAVLRSMTKDAALAGLRLGYAVAHPSVIDVVRRVIPPWSVSSVAQAAGLAAVADEQHAERARAAVAAARVHLEDGLRRLGMYPHPSVANFLLVDVGNGRAVTDALRCHGCIVRDCASFGLASCIRIGVRPIADQERLLAALAALGRPANSQPPTGEAGV